MRERERERETDDFDDDVANRRMQQEAYIQKDLHYAHARIP